MKRSWPHRGLMRLSILACSTLLVGACATAPPTTVILAVRCSEMIPASYRQPVRPPPLLPPTATAGEALATLSAMTSRLDLSNGRTSDLIALAESCDARMAEAQAEVKPKTWRQRLNVP